MASSRPLVSVVIAAHDAADFIGEALGSALAQTYTPLEVIVVDDGSTDATAEVVQALAASDPRVRLIRMENRGPAAARNRAVAAAAGELIAPLDADDLWAPDKLERQVDTLQAAGAETGLVYCWTSAIDQEGRLLAELWRHRTETGEVRDLVVADGLIGNASVPLYRRSVFDEAGGYDEDLRLGEDWDFHTRAAAVARIGLVPAPLVGYRLRPDSATSAGAWRAELAKATRKIRALWPDLAPSLLRRRAFHIEFFLTFLAIRRRAFPIASGLIMRGWAHMPGKIFSRESWDIMALYASHLVGAPAYAWDKPADRAFLEASARGAAARSTARSPSPGPRPPRP